MSPPEVTIVVPCDMNKFLQPNTNRSFSVTLDSGFRCDLCGQRKFESRAELVEHGLREHKSREIKCSVCAFKSSNLQVLMAHIEAGEHLTLPEVKNDKGFGDDSGEAVKVRARRLLKRSSKKSRVSRPETAKLVCPSPECGFWTRYHFSLDRHYSALHQNTKSAFELTAAPPEFSQESDSSVHVENPYAKNPNEAENPVSQQAVKEATDVTSVSPSKEQQESIVSSVADSAIGNSESCDQNQFEAPENQLQENNPVKALQSADRASVEHFQCSENDALKYTNQEPSVTAAEIGSLMSSPELNLEKLIDKDEVLVVRGTDGSFSCPECNHKTSYRFNLRIHLMTHRDEKPFACQICNYRSKWRHNLKAHELRHSSVRRPSVNSKRCQIRELQPNEYPTAAVKIFTCSVAGCSFSSRYSFSVRHHADKVHPQEQESSCTPNSSEHQSELLHESAVEAMTPVSASLSKHEVGECTKNSEASEQRKFNGSRSSDIKNPAASSYHCCPKCDYCTNNKQSLQTHLKKHINVKPFACKACDYRTKWLCNLKTHERRQHSDGQDRPRESKREGSMPKQPKPTAPIDGPPASGAKVGHRKLQGSVQIVKKLNSEDEGIIILRRHGLEDKTLHSKEMTNCPICKSTMMGRFLPGHVLIHTNIKPYACVAVEGCSYRSRWASAVRSHAKTVHKLENM